MSIQVLVPTAAAVVIPVAILAAMAVLMSRSWIFFGEGRAGSSEVVDRDAERLRAELTAMRGRS
ncbi:hypothetical protein [Nocardia sp. CNY236]|uniref:hypothetical protein n=1 Tax=Nocardia sp. CNY236 TaxID=1169152 RepID=UPI000405AD48|nr:hypothetical protein [Nocardia sp. CNY236]